MEVGGRDPRWIQVGVESSEFPAVAIAVAGVSGPHRSTRHHACHVTDRPTDRLLQPSPGRHWPIRAHNRPTDCPVSNWQKALEDEEPRRQRQPSTSKAGKAVPIPSKP